MSIKNASVTKFLDDLNHPLRTEIETLRSIILGSITGLEENIKWNGPNYCKAGDDRITMRIHPPKQIQIILHRGAKKLTQPKQRLIEDDSGLLSWKENDRAVITLKDKTQIETQKAALSDVFAKWIAAASAAS